MSLEDRVRAGLLGLGIVTQEGNPYSLLHSSSIPLGGTAMVRDRAHTLTLPGMVGMMHCLPVNTTLADKPRVPQHHPSDRIRLASTDRTLSERR